MQYPKEMQFMDAPFCNCGVQRRLRPAKPTFAAAQRAAWSGAGRNECYSSLCGPPLLHGSRRSGAHRSHQTPMHDDLQRKIRFWTKDFHPACTAGAVRGPVAPNTYPQNKILAVKNSKTFMYDFLQCKISFLPKNLNATSYCYLPQEKNVLAHNLILHVLYDFHWYQLSNRSAEIFQTDNYRSTVRNLIYSHHAYSI